MDKNEAETRAKALEKYATELEYSSYGDEIQFGVSDPAWEAHSARLRAKAIRREANGPALHPCQGCMADAPADGHGSPPTRCQCGKVYF